MTLPDPEPFPRSTFSRDVLTLVTGTTFAQIIAILSTPFITRLYGPEAYGLLALFVSITGIFGVVVCLRYEIAIVLPKSDRNAANVVGLCMLIIILISILSIPILMLFQKSIEELVKDPQIGDFFWLIPLSIILYGIFQVLNYWNTRSKQFRRLAITQVLGTCSTNGTQLGAGLLGYTSAGSLIGGSLIGQLVSVLALGIQIMKEHAALFKENITWKGMATVLKKYSNFPKYDIWSALLNSVSSSLPIFFLTMYFNPAIVGYYALGMMVLQLPLGLIGNAVAQVFFQRAAEAKNYSSKQLRETVEKTLKPLIFLVIFPSILCILIGPEIFSFIFGINWEESGIYVRYLILWIGIVFVLSPISTLYIIFQKQNISLLLNIFSMIVRTGALLVGGITGDALISIILFAIAGCIANILSFIYLLKLSEVPLIYPAKIGFTYFIFSIPFIILILIFKRAFFSYDFAIVLLSLVISVIYYLLIFRKDPEILNFLKNITAQIPVINKYL